MPGVAWDGYARPVMVLAPARLTADKFTNFQAVTPSEGQLVKVWLRYDETAIRGPAPGFENCRVDDQHGRIVESFAIDVGDPPGGPHGTLSIAARSVDALSARSAFNPGAAKVYDESIPYQTFPEGKRPPWLIPIGYVRWQKLAGQPGPAGRAQRRRHDTGCGPDPKFSPLSGRGCRDHRRRGRRHSVARPLERSRQDLVSGAAGGRRQGQAAGERPGLDRGAPAGAGRHADSRRQTRLPRPDRRRRQRAARAAAHRAEQAGRRGSASR